MEQVFTSYSRRDTQTVDTILEAIDNCPAFVLMLSPNSAASKVTQTRPDADLAVDPGRWFLKEMLGQDGFHQAGWRAFQSGAGLSWQGQTASLLPVDHTAKCKGCASGRSASARASRPPAICWSSGRARTGRGHSRRWVQTIHRSSLTALDQAGCTEPPHGVIYLPEKHGYYSPVAIPWPAAVVPTATP